MVVSIKSQSDLFPCVMTFPANMDLACLPPGLFNLLWVVETHLWRSFIFLCWEICILPILCHGVSIWVLLSSDPISTDGVGLGLISCTRFFLPTMATGEQLSLFAIFYSQWVELPHSYFMDWQPTVVPGFMQKACIQLSTVYRPEGSSPDIVKH